MPLPAPRHRRLTPGAAGDGAGLLVAIPDGFFSNVLMEEQGIKLPPLGAYAAGQVFLPRDGALRAKVKDVVDAVASQRGHVTIAWRPVPTNNRSLGASAIATEPVIEQWFLTATGNHASLEAEQQVCLFSRGGGVDVLPCVHWGGGSPPPDPPCRPPAQAQQRPCHDQRNIGHTAAPRSLLLWPPASLQLPSSPAPPPPPPAALPPAQAH